MQDITPLSGWALNYIVELDGYAEGVCRTFLRSTAERRQVVAALLSATPPPTVPSRAAELGNLVKNAGHRTLLGAAFGEVPIGMRGALCRAGGQPHPRSFYRKLFDLLSSKGPAAKVIHQLPSISYDRLRTVELLPEQLLAPSFASKIGSVRMARDIRALFDLLIAAGIDPKALAESLKRVDLASDFSDHWERWAMKCPFPAHPVPASPNYLPVISGVDLRRMALRYRNCSQRYLSQLLAHQCAFAEFHSGSEKAVVHLRCHRGEWVLDNLYGTDNATVSTVLRHAAVSYLAEHGIGERYREHDVRGGWSVLQRLTRSNLLLDVDFE